MPQAAEGHAVEGRASTLRVHRFGAGSGRPLLMLHGFGSSTEFNWVQSGWIQPLTEAGRRVIAVDLPGHGGNPAPVESDEYAPSRIRAEILQILLDEGAKPLADGDPESGVDIIGYSLGARFAWEFGATQPELVHRMVLGGPSAGDPLAMFDLAEAEEFLASGAPIADPMTADLIGWARQIPGNDMFALLSMARAVKTEPYDAAESVPKMPILFVAGEKDQVAAEMPRLAELSGHAEILILPARNHFNAITSRAFKQAAIQFLAS
ncbi:alpha/beta fold hydrolase [Arthrobacter russicus]|uniref:Pimeloyl-ACP methyl ester carboxylesterase n=1 Tax=Arthrobacter russicus TaxID=172040 RepID=A0ABU1J7F7_9MICC|nr:alpha/beta fold hydrolase [Arthrobacter russicus]MDR6268357.1 pimeloyl-ACP methyl ester carboxylesterase [Arthrobacter russicus]